MPVALDRWPRGGPHLYRCNIEKRERERAPSGVARGNAAFLLSLNSWEEEKGKVLPPTQGRWRRRRRNIFFCFFSVAAATGGGGGTKRLEARGHFLATRFSSTWEMFRWKVRRGIRGIRGGGGGGGTCYLYLLPGALGYFASVGELLRVCQLFIEHETNRVVNLDIWSTSAISVAENRQIRVESEGAIGW